MKRRSPLIFAIILVALNSSCASISSSLAGCGNDVAKEVRSPSGKKKAVIFERDCGATTSFTTQVSILSSNRSLPNEIGNVFVANTDHGKARAGSWGGPLVELSWIDDTHLLLRYDRLAEVSKREQLVGDVNIGYETFAP